MAGALTMGTRTGWFRFVRWPDLDGMHRAGWMVSATLGLPHGEYACLMWRCDCEEAR